MHTINTAMLVFCLLEFPGVGETVGMECMSADVQTNHFDYMGGINLHLLLSVI